jgi:hypothetical protein
MALGAGPEGEADRRTAKIRDAGRMSERRLLTDGVERFAHGALVCPTCNLPIALGAPVSAAEALRCGFCGHAAPARDYLVRDVYDTLANEVSLVAHVAAT